MISSARKMFEASQADVDPAVSVDAQDSLDVVDSDHNGHLVQQSHLTHAQDQKAFPSSPNHQALVSILGQLLLGIFIHLGIRSFRKLSSCCLLPLVIRGTLDLSPLLKSACHVSMFRTLVVFFSDPSYLATTSWYFQPTSWLSLPTVQYFRPGFNLNILSACGTTILCFLS